MKRLTKGQIVTVFIVLIILADQILKIWVKLNMRLGDSHEIAPWFKIFFIENPGMAFGLEIIPKFFLTLFRMVASGALIYYLYGLVRKSEVSLGYIICIGAILAGAVGNLIDCMFYGVVFTDSNHQLATFLPEVLDYSKLFYGDVVDMFYFPLFSGVFPSWMPIWGGQDFLFFRPVFNIADSAVSCGAVALILFYRKQVANL